MNNLIQIGIWLLVGAVVMMFFTHTIVWHKEEKYLTEKYHECKKSGLKPDGEMVWAWLRSLIRRTCVLLLTIGSIIFLTGLFFRG